MGVRIRVFILLKRLKMFECERNARMYSVIVERKRSMYVCNARKALSVSTRSERDTVENVLYGVVQYEIS